jgi:hypothetical protein
MWLPWLVESFPLINVNSQRKKNQKRNCNNNINIYQRTKGKPKGHSLVRSVHRSSSNYIHALICVYKLAEFVLHKLKLFPSVQNISC